jgi:hypothetical protein
VFVALDKSAIGLRTLAGQADLHSVIHHGKQTTYGDKDKEASEHHDDEDGD